MNFEQAVRSGNAELSKAFLDEGQDPNKQLGFLGEPALAVAAEGGHYGVVQLLLEAGADVDNDGGMGETALIVAARVGALEALEVLINAGADLNACGDLGMSGLMWASRWEAPDAMQMLIEAGCDINQQDDSGETALFHVIRNDDLIGFNLLLAANPDLTIVPDDLGMPAAAYAAIHDCREMALSMLITAAHQNPLLTAIGNRDLKAIQAAIQAGASATATEPSLLWPPLFWAAFFGPAGSVGTLIEAGADAQKLINGWSPLLLAARSDCETSVAELLAAGADPSSAEPINKRTALSYAAERGFSTIAKQLIAAGAMLNAVTDEDGKTALSFAAENNHATVVDALLSAGADPNSHGRGEFAPLTWAAESDNPSIIESLLTAGADVTYHKCEALMHAAILGNAAMIRLMVDAGADPNVKSDSGRPLIQAVSSGDLAAIRALLEVGADPNCVSEWREPAIMIAAEHGFDTVVAALIEAGAKLDRSIDGQTVWMIAATQGHTHIVKQIAEAGISFKGKTAVKSLFEALAVGDLASAALLLSGEGDANAVETTSGWPALYFAALLGDLALVNLLIAARANADGRTKDGAPPLHAAAITGRVDIATRLLEKLDTLDVNVGERVLRDAASNGHADVVEVLLAAGVDPNAPTLRGPKALFLAIRAESFECVHALVDAGVSIREDDRNEADLRELHDILELLIHASSPAKSAETPIPSKRSTQTANVVAAENLRAAVVANDTEAVQRCLDNGMKPTGFGGDGLTALCVAARSGNEEIISMLIAAGANVKEPSTGQMSFPPIFWAARSGHSHVVSHLLAKGADVNQPGRGNLTPLMGAVDGNQPSCVTELIAAGADLDLREDRGYSALFNALGYYCSKPEIAEILMDAGADFMTPTERGNQTIGWVEHAAAVGHTEAVRRMIQAGLQPKGLRTATHDGHRETVRLLLSKLGGPAITAIASGDAIALEQAVINKGQTETDAERNWQAILWAAFLHEDDCVKTLLAAGADPNIRQNGCTPLGLSLQGTRNNDILTPQAIHTAHLLISAGADVTKGDYERPLPIFRALLAGQHDLFNAMLAAGANPNAKNHMGSCLQMAISQKQPLIAERLIRAGADVNAATTQFASPLILAIRHHLNHVAQMLLENGANIEKKFDGRTPLHWAVAHSRDQIARQLVGAGAKIDPKDRDGNSPLHLAIERDFSSLISLLIAFGANCGLRNKAGQTPIMRAIDNHQLELIQLLHAAGAKITTKDKRMLPPQAYEALAEGLGTQWKKPGKAWPKLSWAAVKGDCAELSALLQGGASINETEAGYAALMQAVQAGRIASVRWLVENGAALDLKNNNGDTAFDLALAQGSRAIAQVLSAAGGGKIPQLEKPQQIGELAAILGNAVQDAMAVPADVNELLYEGTYTYHRLQNGKHEELASLSYNNDNWFHEQQTLTEIDQNMVSLNLLELGDLRCSYVPQAAIRGYADPEGQFFAVRMTTGLQHNATEFFSAFSDGSTLTTSTSDHSDSEPERATYRLAYPQAVPSVLLAHHYTEIERRRRQGITVTPCQPTVAGLARSMDAFLQRTAGG